MSDLVASAATSVGNVRDHNEDSHLVDADARIFIVADGMGGHAAGEVASALAVRQARLVWGGQSMRRRVAAYADDADGDARRSLLRSVRAGVMNAHLAIVEQARADEAHAGMGTTFTGFLVAGGDAVFAHAGDSRAYLVRDQIAIQLSEDHTVVARLKAAGLKAGEPEPPDYGRWDGVLTNALGTGDGTRISTFLVPLYSGDRILLCSDGVHQYLTEAEVGTIMTSSPSPGLAAQKYVDAALERGGADNATALVVKVVEAGETRIPIDCQQRDDAVVAASPIFAGLTPQQRLRALRITIPRDFKKGETVSPVALGDRVAYLVLDGALRCSDGRNVRAGEIAFPEALVRPPGGSEDAVAQTSVRLLVIRRDDFCELTEDDADLGVKLYASLARILSGSALPG